MVIENSLRTRLTEIVSLSMFKSSENNNVRVRGTQNAVQKQKLVGNPSEETFVSNKSTVKLLTVITPKTFTFTFSMPWYYMLFPYYPLNYIKVCPRITSYYGQF